MRDVRITAREKKKFGLTLWVQEGYRISGNPKRKFKGKIGSKFQGKIGKFKGN
jgi:hypothetical protein